MISPPRMWTHSDYAVNPDHVAASRERIRAILVRHGLRYEEGGRVIGGTQATPSRTFEELLRRHDFRTVADEFERSTKHVDTDPAAALTAACATLESICTVYIQDEGLALPAKKVLGELWSVVRTSSRPGRPPSASLGSSQSARAARFAWHLVRGMRGVRDGATNGPTADTRVPSSAVLTEIRMPGCASYAGFGRASRARASVNRLCATVEHQE